MKRSLLTLSFGCLVAASSCAPATLVDTKGDEAAIRANADAYLKAYNSGDLNGMGARYMADAVEMREEGPELVGKASIMAEKARYFADNTVSQTATVDEVAVWGEVASARGTWQVTRTSKQGDGKPVTTHGKWMVIHKKAADGSWNFWRHIWNQDRSAPAGR